MQVKMLNRNTIAIYIATLFSYQMFMATSLLASMQAWFPNISSNLIVMLFTAPTLAHAAVALILSAVIGRLNKKMLIVIGLGSIVLGGLLVVLIGGASFATALAGVIFCGIGCSLTVTAANTMLVEMNPSTASTTIAVNNAVACLGSMILTTLAGILAQDGNWTRAYYLCFPSAVTLVLFLILYKGSGKASHVSQATYVGSPEYQPKHIVSAGLFASVVIIFLLANFGTSAWNANYSTYIITEKAIGTTIETGLINTLASLGGVIGGFFIAGILIKVLKRWTVPVSMLFIAAPIVAVALGCESITVIYICAFTFMVFYQPVFGELSAAAGKLFPGGGISFVTAMVGLGSFVGPYVVNFVSGLGGGSLTLKFWTGVIFLVIGAIIAVPAMRKVERT